MFLCFAFFPECAFGNGPKIGIYGRLGRLMLPSKRHLYMGNILNVAPKTGNINPTILITIFFTRASGHKTFY